jgi:hypothetical protein
VKANSMVTVFVGIPLYTMKYSYTCDDSHPQVPYQRIRLLRHCIRLYTVGFTYPVKGLTDVYW